jgi:hypothetical protein
MTMAPTIEPWPWLGAGDSIWGWTYHFASNTAAPLYRYETRTEPAPAPLHRKTRKPGSARRKVLARRRTNRIVRRLLGESE